MKRKILLVTVLMFLSLSICISSFATGNMVNSIRNTVGSTENVVENGVKGVTGSISNMGNNMANGISNNNNGMMRTGTDNTYQATRTATTGTDTTGTFWGMTSNMWTWVILAVVAVGIITIVWSYSSDDSKHE